MRATKLVIKSLIIAFSLWRIVFTLLHILNNNMEFSSKTTLSYSILIMSILLLIGVLTESKLLLEIWMICFLLIFGGIVFSVFDFDLERNSLFPNSIVRNTILTSSKYIYIYVHVYLKSLLSLFFSSYSSSHPGDGHETL
jgi:hypothetical protein